MLCGFDKEARGHRPPTSPITPVTRTTAATTPPSHCRRLAAGEDIAPVGLGEQLYV